LQFIPDGCADCPLLRLYDFHMIEARRLQAVFLALADGSLERVPLVEEVGIDAVGECRLDLILGERNIGVEWRGAMRFAWVLTPSRWSDVEGLTEPFAENMNPDTYQWLSRDGAISVLLSPSGRW
jgi:hypothetical protein